MPRKAAHKIYSTAVFLGIAGVLLWPAYYAQLLSFHPWILHSKWMVQGFLCGVALGVFRATHDPFAKISPPFLPSIDSWILLIVAGLHGFQNFALGDSVFSLWLGYLAINLLRSSGDLSGIAQVFWIFSLATGSIGASIGHAHALVTLVNFPVFGNLMLFQCFPAFTLFAATAPRNHSRGSLFYSLALSAAIIASAIIEASGHFTLGFYARWMGFALAVGFLKPFHFFSHTTLFQARWWILAMGLAYLVLRPLYQVQQASFNHLYFMGVGGLGLLVVGLKPFQSGDNPSLPIIPSKSWKWWLFWVILATLTRITPVWVPSTTLSHHIYAAITWIVVLAMWLRWQRLNAF